MTYAHGSDVYDLVNVFEHNECQEVFKSAVEQMEKEQKQDEALEVDPLDNLDLDLDLDLDGKDDDLDIDLDDDLDDLDLDPSKDDLDSKKNPDVKPALPGADNLDESSSDYEGGKSEDEEESKSAKNEGLKAADRKNIKSPEESKVDLDNLESELKLEETKSDAEGDESEDVIEQASKIIEEKDGNGTQEYDSNGPLTSGRELKNTLKEETKSLKSKDEETNDKKGESETLAPQDDTPQEDAAKGEKGLVDNWSSDEEEEEKKKSEPETKPEPEETILDRFNKLNKEKRQKVVDITLDDYYQREESKQTWNYHGYAPDPDREHQNVPERFNIPEYVIPSDEKMAGNIDGSSYPTSIYKNWNVKKKYHDLEYKPQIIRHKLQISLWRADDFGVAKTKFKYFTPKSVIFDLNKKFSIIPSLDKETIIIKQEPTHREMSYLVLILDAYTLEVLHEHEVLMRDAELSDVPEMDSYYDTNYDDDDSYYPTQKDNALLYSWNKGRYLMHGITKSGMASIFALKIWDLEEKKVLNTVLRKGDLTGKYIYDVKVDPDNLENLFFATWLEKKPITVCTMNIMSGELKSVGKSSPKESVSLMISLNDSCTKVFTNTYVQMGSQRLMKIYQYDINSKAEFDDKPSKDPNEM